MPPDASLTPDLGDPVDPPSLDDTGEIPVIVVEPDAPSQASEPGFLGDDPDAQWFTGEIDPSLIRAPRRDHVVTAVVVSHDGATWLPAVLTTLAHQSRPADVAVGVDTASQDGSADLLQASMGADRTVRLDENPGFGAAVREGLAHLAARGLEPIHRGHVEWVWLLHDDSAPDPDCLARLLDTADDHPEAAILGPKVLGWHDRRLLLEVGVTVSGSGRRVTGLERREHDQGQHDGVRDVLAVSSAGMLVRRDIWDALGGFDPALPLFRDDLDLCWRAQRMGERVLVATDAVIHHREAAAHGRRVGERRPHRDDREASAHVLLAHAAGWIAPLLAVRLLLGSAVRSLVYLLGKDVAAARDEVSAVWAVATHPASLRASRRLVAATSTAPASVVQPLKVHLGEQVRHAVEVVTGVVTTSGSSTPAVAVSALETGPATDDSDYLDDSSPGLLRRTILRPSVLLVVGLVVIAILGARGLWLGDGVLQGGALLPAPEGAADVWESYRQAWHNVGPGSTVPSAPYLVVVALLSTLLLGKAPVAVTVIVLLAIPLAGWSAYICLRGMVPSKAIRVWAAAAYALLPAITGAVASGRIGLAISAVAIPFALRSLVRVAGRNGTTRRAAGTAMLVAIVLASTPSVWVVLLAGGVVASIVLLTRRTTGARRIVGRLAIGLLVPLILLAPWSWYALAHPVVLLLEPGVNAPSLTDASLRPWQVLLLHPGGPGMTPWWLAIGILAAGLLSFLRADRLRITGAFGALAGLALLMGLAQSVILVTPPGAAGLTRPWPGPATLLMGLALIAAAAVAAEGMRDRLIGTSFTIGQPITALVVVAALLVPAVCAVLVAAGLPSMLRRAPASSVPAFVAADAQGPQAPRTLVLEQVPDGPVRYSLINGAGLVLGDAETEPPAEVWSGFDAIVADIASGRGGDEIRALDGYGVRYVQLAASSARELVPTIDAEPGLRRLSTSEGETLWRVNGVTSRARLVSGTGATALGIAPDGTVTADPYLDQRLPDGRAGRVISVGATLDPAWRAVDASGQELSGGAAPGLLSWSQGFQAPQGATPVRIWFDSAARSRWLWLEVVVLVVLVIMALPSRRIDPDPDFDEELLGTDIASEPHHGGDDA